MSRQFKIKIFILCATLIVAIFYALIKGPAEIPVRELLLQQNRELLFLRLSRIATAIITGMGLSVCGIALQAILRNPLAEPYLLGTSSGAGLGAVLAIITGMGSVYLPFMAFLGAIFTVILVYNLSRQGNKIPVQSLILSGVIISIAFSGIVVFLISISSNEALHGAMWWLWGSTQVYDLKLLALVSAIVIGGIAFIFIFAQDLNAISIGEEDAIHLGVNTESLKKILFIVTSLITAALVSLCGIIGFVGLIIPHIMRNITGPDHKLLIPCTCLAAAAFMVICDLFARTLFSPMEIPIGVITAAVGTPVFVILLRRKQAIR